MAGALDILVVAHELRDARRAAELARQSACSIARLECSTFAPDEIERTRRGAWDIVLLVLAASRTDDAVEAARRALAPWSASAPLVLLAEDYLPSVAAAAHHHGATVCLFAHGPELLGEAIARALERVPAHRQRALEQAVHESERMRALVYLNVADVLFRLDVEGERFRFSEINPAFTRATGLTEAQVVGRFVDEVIPEPSLSLVLSKYREAIRERRTVRWEETTEYRAGTRHGEVSVTPLSNARGECICLVGTVHDVTAVREAESRARAINAAERDVLEQVAAGAPLASTLTQIARAIESHADGAMASVLLLSADGTRLLHGAAPALPEAFSRAIDGALIGPRVGSCGSAAALKRPVVARDITTDPCWEDYRELARAHGLRACWSVPITASDGRVLGTFALYYREPHEPSDDERDLLARATHVAGIAIQRRDLDEQLRALSARIEAAREDERTGIAREIHDELGQALTAIKFDLAWIARRARAPGGIEPDGLTARLAAITAMTDEVIQQVRRISSDLRPGVLDDIGLVAAIKWRAEQFAKRTGVECVVEASESDEPSDRAITTAVFRVFEEALTNVARHAHARRIDVALDVDAGHELVLRVRDDGRGIPAEAVADLRSLGLLGIRERARALGGTASFAPIEPHGTLVTLRVPLAQRPSSTAGSAL